jgi:putative restriction endonuclease
VIRAVGAEGGLPENLYDLLRARPALVNRIAQQVLEDQWEPSYHQDILETAGMPWVQVTTRRKRNPQFRALILRIYEHRCAICGWDGQLGHADLALEAAHVRWHTVGGPDTADNGLCLCSFHHKVFDRGAIGLDDQCRILVSQHLRGSRGLDELMLRFAGSSLRQPQTGEPQPAQNHLRWHRREVFLGPARSR